MGNRTSHFRRQSCTYEEKIDPELDPLNLQTLAALKAARERPGKHELTFEKLLLKFGDLEAGFDRCHEVFTSSSHTKSQQFSADKKLPLLEVRKAREDLGIHLTTEEANEIFKIPPNTESEILVLFIDFVRACCILVMLKGPESVLQEGADKDVVKMALLVLDAFNYLDSHENGFLFKEDITEKLRDVDGNAHAAKKETPLPRNDAIEQRWAFMDYDKDGRASFRDFLTSLHGWVMGDRSK